MRLVLDTNVVVSALLWSGAPHRLLQAAVNGDFILFTSPALLAELGAVLRRKHLASRLIRQQSSVDLALTFYASFVVSVSPMEIPRVVPGDADDDHVVAAAVAAQAHFIVSGDHHLLSLGDHRNIGIITPGDALRLIAGA